MNISDTLISFETAKLAKEKRFDLSVMYHYWLEESNWILKPNYQTVRGVDIFTTGEAIKIDIEELTTNYDTPGNPDIFRAAPTQSLLAKWLREVHGLYVDAHPSHTDNKLFKTTFVVEVVHLHKLKFYSGAEQNKDYFESYEEALEEGLFSALKLIKI